MLQGDEEQSALARVPFDSEISISLQFRTPAQKNLGGQLTLGQCAGSNFFGYQCALYMWAGKSLNQKRE